MSSKTFKDEISERLFYISKIDPLRKYEYFCYMPIEELRRLINSEIHPVKETKPIPKKNKPIPSQSKKPIKHTPHELPFTSSYSNSKNQYDPQPHIPPSYDPQHDDSRDDFIRQPDQVYRDQLIPSDPFNRIDNIPSFSSNFPIQSSYPPFPSHLPQLDEDDEYEKAIKESLLSFEEDRKNDIVDQSIEDLANELADDVSDDVHRDKLVKSLADNNDWSHLEIPGNFDIDILLLIYDQLKNNNFVAARKTISNIPDLSNLGWVNTLKYKDKNLKEMVKTSNPDAYKCIRP